MHTNKSITCSIATHTLLALCCCCYCYCCCYCLQSFQETASAQALSQIKEAPQSIQALQDKYEQVFGKSLVQSQQAVQQSTDLLQNATVSSAIEATLEAVDQTLAFFDKMNRYITLTLPLMEDGGNFGVTIQLGVLKQITDSQEKIEKSLDDLLKYASTRAEALTKCSGLNEVQVVSTQTTGTSQSQGESTEKGQQTTSDQKKSTEEKTTSTQSQSPLAAWRLQAVQSVDLAYYAKARSLYQTALTAYLGGVDMADKNAQKLAHPKGNQGGGSGYRSMY
jgi:Proteasome activator pa28 beta subunit